MEELTVGRVPDVSEEKKPEPCAHTHNIFFFFHASKNQSQFKAQGTKLTPDCPSELALMYQRMFEGFTLAQKSGLSTKQDALHEKHSIHLLSSCGDTEAFHS